MKTTILLVDDNATDRLILRSIFEHYGCEVVEAADGQEGLARALHHMPDLIISDALMPRMDGYQFLKAVKDDNRLRAIPFVFYTAVYTSGKESRLAVSLGAEDFLVKPLSAPVIWERISQIRSRTPRSAAEQPAAVMDEDSFLKQYSAVVASKLEEKVRDLEREIAERRSAEETVRRQHEELRALSARLADAEEQERRRIARELHDQVGQNLTALGISLNILRAQLPPSPLHARIDDSLKLLEDTTARVRELMIELRPPLLDDYGLAAAVEWYAREFGGRANLVVEVTAPRGRRRQDPVKEITLFRILQEALTNVAKHASASRVQVRLEDEGPLVRMTVRDDGGGFEPGIQGAAGRPTWGLLNMAERARMIGGTCRVESAPGEGTRVVAEVAL